MKEVEPVKPYDKQRSKKDQIEEMFDHIAPKYDLLNRVLSMRIDSIWRKALVSELRKTHPQKILDIACGTGDLSMAIQKGTGGIVTGLDLSQNMLDVGLEKLKRHGLESKISMMKGDAEALPFPDDEFDAVTVAFGVRNFENLEKGLSEMKRVIKPGKKAFILEFSNMQGFWSPLYNVYFKHVLPCIGKLVSKDDRAYKYLPDSVGSFPCGEEMRSILTGLGYKNVEYQRLHSGIATIYQGEK